MDELTAARIIYGIEIDEITHCWIWQNTKTKKGYGQFQVAGKRSYVHRASWETFMGPIPAGLQIDHLCGITSCCNPQHLEPVTCRINLLRGNTITAKCAAVTECPVGHLYDEKNTYVSKKGSRTCRKCRARKVAELRERRRS